MNKRLTPTFSPKQRAPELGHRIEPHQQFRQSFHQRHGHSYCTSCGAISYLKHWYIDPAQGRILRQEKVANPVLCPGYARVEQEAFEGEVVLDNSCWSTLMGEIVALIKHTEGKCWHDNPISKLGAVTEEGDKLHIFTTTRWLAERIGKELQKAFKGNLVVKRTPAERFVRVYWTD